MVFCLVFSSETATVDVTSQKLLIAENIMDCSESFSWRTYLLLILDNIIGLYVDMISQLSFPVIIFHFLLVETLQEEKITNSQNLHFVHFADPFIDV